MYVEAVKEPFDYDNGFAVVNGAVQIEESRATCGNEPGTCTSVRFVRCSFQRKPPGLRCRRGRGR